MTREEAIEILIDQRDNDVFVSEWRNTIHEALNMAIEALQTEPCEDCISRQAVRYILNHEVKMPIKVWKKLFELVDDLPSVQPKQKVKKWTHDGSKWENRWLCECGYKLFGEKTKFCPDCGAKMEEGE